MGTVSGLDRKFGCRPARQNSGEFNIEIIHSITVVPVLGDWYRTITALEAVKVVLYFDRRANTYW